DPAAPQSGHKSTDTDPPLLHPQHLGATLISNLQLNRTSKANSCCNIQVMVQIYAIRRGSAGWAGSSSKSASSAPAARPYDCSANSVSREFIAVEKEIMRWIGVE